MTDVWQLESGGEVAASEILSVICGKALAGNEEEQKYLEGIFEEPWERIQKKLAAEGSTWYVWWMDGVHKFMRESEEFASGLVEAKKAQKEESPKYSEIKFDLFNKGFKGRVDEISPAVFLAEKRDGISKEALQKAMASPGDWIKVAQIGKVTVPSGIYEYLRCPTPPGTKTSPADFPHGTPEIEGKLAVLVNTAGETGEKLRNQIEWIS